MAGKLMRAVQYSGYGGGAAGLKQVEVPVPDTNAGEVLLKLEATSLNPVDWKIQKGMLRLILPRKFPYIPGTDVAGEVIKVGPRVNKFKAGDKVVAILSHTKASVSHSFGSLVSISRVGGLIGRNLLVSRDRTGGGLAEYAVAKETLTAARPPEVSAAEAASLPVAGLTALQALTHACGIKLDGSGEKKNILITAGSGGVGHYVVQLAKLGNTHVTATCGARNLDFVKSLGADEVIDYKTPEGAALKSPSGIKYDYVIHGAVGIPWSTFEPNLTSNGKVIDLTPSPSAMWTFAVKKLTFSKKTLVPLLLVPKAENLEYLVGLVKEKRVKTVVDSAFPLSKAEDAWEKIVSGHATGKIVVEP